MPPPLGRWPDAQPRQVTRCRPSAPDERVDVDADSEHIAIVGLGVRDFDRAKRFYSEGVLAEAERAGATITTSPTPTSWGGYGGYFADPEGHLWEVATGATQLPFSE